MAGLRTNPCLQAIDAVLVEYGIPYTVEMGGKHPRAVINGADGSPKRIGFSLTPSDRRAPLKAAAEARRILRASFPALFGDTLEKESSMGTSNTLQTVRKSEAFLAVKNELDEAQIPFEVVRGTKHPAVRFVLEGRPHTIPVTLNAKSGPSIENARHQVRRIIRAERPMQVMERDDDFTIAGTPTITTADLVLMSGEPRIRDLDLAVKLGFSRPRNIRSLIERNLQELQANLPLLHGEASSRSELSTEDKRERGESYWLNETQAILVIMKSDTPMAEALRVAIAAVFIAWREERGFLSMAAPVDPLKTIPSPDEVAASVGASVPAPFVPLPVPQILADDTAIDLITDMVGLKMEALLGPTIDRALDRLVADRLPAAIERILKPLLSSQVRWASKQRTKMLGALTPLLDDALNAMASQSLAVDMIASRVDTGFEAVKAAVEGARRQTMAVSATTARTAYPTPQPASRHMRHTWDLDEVRDALMFSDPVPRKNPTIPAAPVEATSMGETDPMFTLVDAGDRACILDVYTWSRLNVPVIRRRSLSQSLNKRMQKRFGEDVQRRYIPAKSQVYNFYPKAALRSWFDDEGERLIREHVFPLVQDVERE